MTTLLADWTCPVCHWVFDAEKRDRGCVGHLCDDGKLKAIRDAERVKEAA